MAPRGGLVPHDLTVTAQGCFNVEFLRLFLTERSWLVRCRRVLGGHCEDVDLCPDDGMAIKLLEGAGAAPAWGGVRALGWP